MDFAVNALVILSLAGQVAAEAPEKTELAKALQSLYRREAAEYEFALDSARKEKLKLLEKPVMSWTGQNAGFVSGDVFVWTRNGRAEVIGCIGSLPGETSRGVFHEFHALTDKPLPEVEIATGRRWRPRQPGVITKPVPGAAVPGATGARRMLEMRKLARQFTSRMQARSGEERLRLLPQPIYRYDTKSLAASNLPVSDGAIFAYVWTRGTDPEFLLLLESRQSDTGTRWEYAPVRFTYRELWLVHEGQELWHVEADHGRNYIGPYLTAFAGSRPIRDILNQAEKNND